MSGGSPAHAQLIARFTGLLVSALRGKPRFAQSSSQRVRIGADHATYPDAMVVCPPLERAVDDRDAITNPTVVIEVLSPSTQAYDRGGKFELYRSLPSVRHFVLVAQNRWRVDYFRRMDDGSWRFTSHGPGDEVVLDAVGVGIRIDELYEGMEAFDGPRRDAAPGAEYLLDSG